MICPAPATYYSPSLTSFDSPLLRGPEKKEEESSMPYTTYRPPAQSRARSLRHNMTTSERHLWYDFLNTYPVRFWKQRPIGPYIVDFLCYDAALVVELDGSSHDAAGQYDHDERRTHYLQNHGFRVLRLGNYDVQKHFEEVCAFIDRAVKDRGIEGRFSSQ